MIQAMYVDLSRSARKIATHGIKFVNVLFHCNFETQWSEDQTTGTSRIEFIRHYHHHQHYQQHPIGNTKETI
jgi:hypothetical protein